MINIYMFLFTLSSIFLDLGFFFFLPSGSLLNDHYFLHSDSGKRIYLAYVTNFRFSLALERVEQKGFAE